MDYSEVYNKFWATGVKSKFEDYNRNLLLPDFFPITNNAPRVCDIAGGAGIVSEWLMARGYDVTLLEFSPNAIEEAKARGVKKIVDIKFESNTKLPFADSFFDVAFFGDIIEHLFDAESLLLEIKRILKPGGRLIVSCPNMSYWRFRTYYLFDGDFERIDVAKQKPWEQEHIRFFNARILKEFICGKLGFKYCRLMGANDIWHSRKFVKFFPNLFAQTIVVEFKKYICVELQDN